MSVSVVFFCTIKTVRFKDQWVESQWRVDPMESQDWGEPVESKDWQEWGDVPQPAVKVQDWGNIPQPSIESQDVGEPAPVKSQDWQDWEDWDQVPQPAMEVQDWGNTPQPSIESQDVGGPDWQDWGQVPQPAMEVQDWGNTPQPPMDAVPEGAPDTTDNTDAASVATTLSLGPSWEEETHAWKKQPDGSFQKVPKIPKQEQYYSPRGELLPSPTLTDLVPWMVNKGWESRVDVGKFFYTWVPDEKYIMRLYDEGFLHPALTDFEKYISEFYEVPLGEWMYGWDLDPIEDVIDLVHFLATQRKLATDKNEKDVVGEIKKDAGVKGDKVPGDSAVRFRHRKKRAGASEPKPKAYRGLDCEMGTFDSERVSRFP